MIVRGEKTSSTDPPKERELAVTLPAHRVGCRGCRGPPDRIEPDQPGAPGLGQVAAHPPSGLQGDTGRAVRSLRGGGAGAGTGGEREREGNDDREVVTPSLTNTLVFLPERNVQTTF